MTEKSQENYDRLKEDRQGIEIDFGDTPDKLKGEYFNMYDGITSEVLSTTKFGENSDLSTTYLGRINMTRLDKIKAKEKCHIRTRVYSRKAIRWHGMSDIFSIWKQVNHLL